MRYPRWEHTWIMLDLDLGERAAWCAMLEEAASPNRLDLWFASYFGELEGGRRGAITGILTAVRGEYP